MKYTFRVIHRNEKFTQDDSFEEWITAISESSAKHIIEHAYPARMGYECKLISYDSN